MKNRLLTCIWVFIDCDKAQEPAAEFYLLEV